MLELLFGLIIISVVIYIAFRIFQNVAVGIVLVLLVLFASYLILGSLPDITVVPVIGGYLSKFPKTTGDSIATIKNVLYNLDIISLSRDSENNLLITIANTGKIETSKFTVFIDNTTVDIINAPKDPLKSGEVTIIQTNWKGDFKDVLVQTEKVNATYAIS
jgi:hypothetical protein